MDDKTKQVLGVFFICVAIVLFIAFAATTGMSRTNLKDFREEPGDHEKHVTFSHKGEDIVTLSVRATPGAYADNSTIPLMVLLSHTDTTKIDSLKISIHPPQTASHFSYGDIFLKTPEWNPYPMLSFHTDTESGKSVSVLDIPDMGVQGKGTVRLDFMMHPFWEAESPESLTVYISAEFWNTYVVNYPVGVEFTR